MSTESDSVENPNTTFNIVMVSFICYYELNVNYIVIDYHLYCDICILYVNVYNIFNLIVMPV